MSQVIIIMSHIMPVGWDITWLSYWCLLTSEERQKAKTHQAKQFIMDSINHCDILVLAVDVPCLERVDRSARIGDEDAVVNRIVSYCVGGIFGIGLGILDLTLDLHRVYIDIENDAIFRIRRKNFTQI